MFVHGLEQPQPALLTSYILHCLPALLIPPAGIVLLLVHYFRYRTMRYRFDEQGISMRWGMLYRKETVLNYARIQDIHLVSTFVERWLGIARIQIQTASGSATPEMTLEGLPDHERVRDYLYSRMRGTRDQRREAAVPRIPALPGPDPSPGGDAELAGVLREVAAELRQIREKLTPQDRA